MQRGTRKLFRVLDTFIILIVVLFHKCGHMPKFTKFYTLNICGLFMSVYLSKFVFQKHTQKKENQKGHKVPEGFRWRAVFLNLGFPLKSLSPGDPDQ